MADDSLPGRDLPLMLPAALGFRAHSGWTALVAVSLERDGPRVLLRQRPHVVETFTYEFRQPYHTAQSMPLEKAREFVSRVESEAKRLAEEAIRSVLADLRPQGYRITRFGLLRGSGKPLPSLDRILSSHALIHAADGELFREALIHGGRRCRLAAFTITERELLPIASKTLKIREAELMARLTALGKPVGPPWSQDEKFAALAAWLALVTNTGTNTKPSQKTAAHH